jgi:hypothetical protein
MKVHDLKDKQGRVFAFEVPNTLLSRRGVCKLVRSIPGAHVLNGRAELRQEGFCTFEVQRQKFKAWEPWGDGSRYWIGPEAPGWCEQISVVRDAFIRHIFLGSILGNQRTQRTPRFRVCCISDAKRTATAPPSSTFRGPSCERPQPQDPSMMADP